MPISSFEGQEVRYVPSSRGVHANILAPGTWIKNTLLSHNLKVEEKKMIFVFIHGPGAEILAFISFEDGAYLTS